MSKHGMPDIGAHSEPEREEHGHVGGTQEGAGFKRTDKAAQSVRVDEVDSDTTYVGEAVPGTATSAASWRIKKISVSGTVTSIEWADGNELYDNVWDNRASLTYS